MTFQPSPSKIGCPKCMTYRARCLSVRDEQIRAQCIRGGIAPYPNGYSKRVNVSRLLSLEADVVRSTHAYVYAHIECAWSSNVFVFLSLHMHMFDYIKLQRKIHCHCIFSCFWDIFYSFFQGGFTPCNGNQWDPQKNPLRWCALICHDFGGKSFFYPGAHWSQDFFKL